MRATSLGWVVRPWYHAGQWPGLHCTRFLPHGDRSASRISYETSSIETPSIRPAGVRDDHPALRERPAHERVVVHNDTVYLAGLTADATAGKSVGEQTTEILGKIDGLLKQGGTDKSKLVQATIWLQDIRTVDEFNKVWDAWVVPGSDAGARLHRGAAAIAGEDDRDSGDRGEVGHRYFSAVIIRASGCSRPCADQSRLVSVGWPMSAVTATSEICPIDWQVGQVPQPGIGAHCRRKRCGLTNARWPGRLVEIADGSNNPVGERARSLGRFPDGFVGYACGRLGWRPTGLLCCSRSG